MVSSPQGRSRPEHVIGLRPGLTDEEDYRNVSVTGTGSDRTETQIILVRYWASAREAAGTDAERVPVDGTITLADLLARLVAEHADARFEKVVGACSVLVGDRPVKNVDPATVVVEPGASVELLPPFAGG